MWVQQQTLPLCVQLSLLYTLRRYTCAVHISVAVDMHTLLDRKNFSSNSNGQIAAHQVTELIIKRLWLYDPLDYRSAVSIIGQCHSRPIHLILALLRAMVPVSVIT